MSSPHDARLDAGILALLRGLVPQDEPAEDHADRVLGRLECGGYLHVLWSKGGRTAALHPAWSRALERAHRKTRVDTLAALADFRMFGRILEDLDVPFILLKGGGYLFDLYDDLGERPLTDIDILIRPADAVRAYLRFEAAGFESQQWDEQYRKFQVVAPGPARCSLEVHWRLGLAERVIDQDGLWERSLAAVLEEIPSRRLAVEDALLYHVAHHADHFFEPSLKWVIDLRQMLHRWRPDEDLLIERASAWGVRTALSVALSYLEKLFPGETPAGLTTRLRLGAPRRWLMRPFLDPRPLGILDVGNRRLSRYWVACLLIDRLTDTSRGLVRALMRPFLRLFPRGRDDGRPSPLWR